MSLKDVVDTNENLRGCWKKGMQALRKKDKSLIKAAKGICKGGIDIDACLKNLCRHENRWGYGLGVGEKGVFVEVHSAHTTEVNAVLAKLEWLKEYFSAHCSGFSNLDRSYYWVASGQLAIRKGTPQERRLVKAGIKGPVSSLDLRKA